MSKAKVLGKMVRTMEIGVEDAKRYNRRPTIVGYIRDAAERKLWYACTPSMTLSRISTAQAVKIMATQTMQSFAGA
jgi:hypothetical protein